MISNYGLNAVADLITGRAAMPTYYYLALLLSEADALDTGSTISEPGGNYTRLQVEMSDDTWAAPSGGISYNSSDWVWPVVPSTDWGTLTSAETGLAAAPSAVVLAVAVTLAVPY